MLHGRGITLMPLTCLQGRAQVCQELAGAESRALAAGAGKRPGSPFVVRLLKSAVTVMATLVLQRLHKVHNS